MASLFAAAPKAPKTRIQYNKTNNSRSSQDGVEAPNRQHKASNTQHMTRIYHLAFAHDFCRTPVLLLCSDGIWEFMLPQEVIDLVSEYGPDEAQDAADALAKFASERWLREEAGTPETGYKKSPITAEGLDFLDGFG